MVQSRMGREEIMICVLAAMVALSAPPAGASAISYAAKKLGSTTLHVVTIDLNSYDVKVSGVVSKRLGVAEPVGQMVHRARPAVAITGTFHSLQTKRPVGDIVIDGECVNWGHIPSCLAIDWFGKATIVHPAWGCTQKWRDYEYVLGAGIRIMKGGVVAPDLKGRKDGSLSKPNPRVAAGITKDNKLILIATRKKMTLSGVAKVLKSMGAREAICFDGGSSVCLYYRGRMVLPTGRRLTNLLVAYDRPELYRQVKSKLSPQRAEKIAR